MKKLCTLLALNAFVFTLAFAQDKTKCVQFDGVDDKIVVDHISALNLGRSAFTIEAYIVGHPNMMTNSVLSPIVLSKKGANSASTDGMLFGLDGSGKLALQIEGQSFQSGFGGGPGVTAVDLRDNLCHHFAWTREVGGVEDTVNGYQDGAYVKKTRKAAGLLDISNTEDVWIGASEFNTSPNTYQFEGQIKEIRIWNYARTENEIWTDKDNHLVGNENGLIFYWRMHEDSATTIYDCGPNSADGTMDGATWATFGCNNMKNAIPSPNNCVPSGPPPPTGVEEIKADAISVFPNPFTNELKLSSESEVDMDMISIFNIDGKVVLRKSWNGKASLNVSELDRGTYFIQLSKQGNIIARKMMTKN